MVTLLGQRVDLLGIITIEEKLRAVLSLDFPRTLKQLETYLGLVGYLRTKNLATRLDRQSYIR